MPDAVEEFERECAALLGVAGGVATGFGRSALVLALEALAVDGSDVLVPNFICAQVVEAVRRASGRPMFYSVGQDLAVDAERFEATLTAETRAAIVAHYFGRPPPGIGRLSEICRMRSVALIEDCALALEARADGRRAGAFGDAAVYSFTKSDWCYGGGIVTSDLPALLARMRALRLEKFKPYRALSFRYGLLRRADFAANRPSLSRVAERAGRWLQRLSGLDEGNFYDAGRFDASLPAFAARRARHLLANLSGTTSRRQQILRRITETLSGAGPVLLRPHIDPGDAGSFLLVQCPDDRAKDWVEEAARHGVTLRRCWPAYQTLDAAQASPDVSWLAAHLLVLEIHPQLRGDEIEKIERTLRSLARS